MIPNILTKIFGSRNERLLKQYAQVVEEIKASGASLDELIDQQVKSDQAIARKIELDVVNANSKPER